MINNLQSGARDFEYGMCMYLLIRPVADSTLSSTERRADCSAEVVATQVLCALRQLSLPTHLQPPAVSEE